MEEWVWENTTSGSPDLREQTCKWECCGIAGLQGLVLGFVFSSHLPYTKSKPSEASATVIPQQLSNYRIIKAATSEVRIKELLKDY